MGVYGFYQGQCLIVVDFEMGGVLYVIELVQVVWQYVCGEQLFGEFDQGVFLIVDFVQQDGLVEQCCVCCVQVGVGGIYCCIEFVGVVGMQYYYFLQGQCGQLVEEGFIDVVGQYYW